MYYGFGLSHVHNQWILTFQGKGRNKNQRKIYGATLRNVINEVGVVHGRKKERTLLLIHCKLFKDHPQISTKFRDCINERWSKSQFQEITQWVIENHMTVQQSQHKEKWPREFCNESHHVYTCITLNDTNAAFPDGPLTCNPSTMSKSNDNRHGHGQHAISHNRYDNSKRFPSLMIPPCQAQQSMMQPILHQQLYRNRYPTPSPMQSVAAITSIPPIQYPSHMHQQHQQHQPLFTALHSLKHYPHTPLMLPFAINALQPHPHPHPVIISPNIYNVNMINHSNRTPQNKILIDQKQRKDIKYQYK